MAILHAAKERRIQVFALESGEGMDEMFRGDEATRLKKSAATWQAIIERNRAKLKPGESFLAITGGAHNSFFDAKGHTVTGLDSLLGVKGIDIVSEAGAAFLQSASALSGDLFHGAREHDTTIKQLRPEEIAQNGYQFFAGSESKNNLLVLKDGYGVPTDSPLAKRIEFLASNIKSMTQEEFQKQFLVDMKKEIITQHGATLSDEQLNQTANLFLVGFLHTSLPGSPDPRRADGKPLYEEPEAGLTDQLLSALNGVTPGQGITSPISLLPPALLDPGIMEKILSVKSILQREGDATNSTDTNHEQLITALGELRSALPENLMPGIPDLSKGSNRE
jgi:hypothetical protein